MGWEQNQFLQEGVMALQEQQPQLQRLISLPNPTELEQKQSVAKAERRKRSYGRPRPRPISKPYYPPNGLGGVVKVEGGWAGW